jgi:tryptophanyl-tRNA synthetase
VKMSLAKALNAFLDPIRERRVHYAQGKGLIEEIIFEGTERMNVIANETVKEMKSLMGLSGNWKKIARIAMDRKRAKI